MRIEAQKTSRSKQEDIPKGGAGMSKKVNRREFLKVSAAAGLALSMASDVVFAEEPKAVQLLKPSAGAGNPFLQLLWKRKSSREFSPEPLPVGVLSNLLWAAFGIHRGDKT